jgi:hypothetical protein
MDGLCPVNRELLRKTGKVDEAALSPPGSFADPKGWKGKVEA